MIPLQQLMNNDIAVNMYYNRKRDCHFGSNQNFGANYNSKKSGFFLLLLGLLSQYF